MFSKPSPFSRSPFGVSNCFGILSRLALLISAFPPKRFIPSDFQHLLRKMIQGEPQKRIAFQGPRLSRPARGRPKDSFTSAHTRGRNPAASKTSSAAGGLWTGGAFWANSSKIPNSVSRASEVSLQSFGSKSPRLRSKSPGLPK